MSAVVVGLNHRTVPLDVLERMTVDDAGQPKALLDLTTRPHISEAVVLSTCNRTEIYVVAERYHGAIDDVRTFLCDLSGLNIDAFNDHLYAYHDDAAVAHLFKVSTGIDSAVLGESEILGQVRAAWEKAQAEQAAGAVLGRLFRHAVEVGKRARTETGIARGTTSMSQAAVAMAADHLGSLDGCRVLVLGAGDMGEGLALALAGAPGVSDVLVANRTGEKAAALAARIGGRSVGVDDLATSLDSIDVLLTSTGAPTVLLEADDLRPVMANRRARPLLIVDIAVPRDVDPAVADIDGVTLLGMDDLRTFAEAGIAGRRREIARVEAIIDEEVGRWIEVAAGRELAPLVAALRDRAEEIRAAEIDRHRARLAGLEARERESVEALTRAIVNKILHEPTVRLKGAAGSASADRLAESLRELFDL
ncbi:MAG: glutamyl-tRNA reductase [Acidimicrobiales bacterium]